LNRNTESVNFSRNINIYTSDDKENWKHKVSGNISKVSIGGYKNDELKLNLPEIRQKYLLLRIDNGDAPVLKDIELQCYGSIYDVEFLTTAQLSRVKFYYGGELDSPKYDIDEILGRIKAPRYVLLSLESEEKNPLYSSEVSSKSFFESRVLLYIVIGVMVIVLGAALFKTVKKIDEEGADHESH